MITKREQEILLTLLREMLAVNYQVLKDVDASVSPVMYGDASRDIAAASILIGKVLTMTTVDVHVSTDAANAMAYHGPKCVHDYPIAIPRDDPRNCPICTDRKCIHGKPLRKPCEQCAAGQDDPATPPPDVPIQIASAQGIDDC